MPTRWSITSRLTALYTLSTVAVLALVGAFLYLAIRDNLRREDAEYLTDKLEVTRGLLRDTLADSMAIAEEVVREPLAGGHPIYFARIVDASGRTRIETPGMSELLPATSFPQPRRGETFRHLSADQTRDGAPYLLATGPGGPAGSPIIQLALDVSREDALLKAYRRRMLLAIFGGAALSAAVGFAIARRGLRPVERITRAAERVTASRLDERIGSEPWPRELAVLAAVFDGMLARLEESFARLSRFSADLAHELRTPINNLMGETEVALSRSRDPDEYRHVLESGLEEYGRLSRMIDSLLFLARAEGARAPLDLQTVDARAAAEAVVEFHHAVAEDRRVTVRCEGGATLLADPILLRRALSNLLSNALRHTTAGGTVTISSRMAGDGWAEVLVRDTGSGIAPEHVSRVFDRFYRADPARAATAAEGAGLGLAIVKSIMELHGGTVGIESRVGAGTTVTLRFPAGSGANITTL